jgi:ABC-2 type transport system ATP-binding protein
MSRLEVVELRKCYGDATVVNGVSFAVQPGEIFGLLGPNGAGKTTTMSLIAGLLSPDGGSVEWNGTPIDKLPRESRQWLGMAPQELAIYPDLSARENLEFFGKLYGLRGALLQQRCEEVLAEIGLTDHARRHTGHFSGGMKRRLNLGIALIHQPQLLILDEPTVGVDPQSRSRLLECVRHAAAAGVAVIYASHYMEEVSAVCDRIAIMDHGVILAMDRLENLLRRLRPELVLRVRGLSESTRTELAEWLVGHGAGDSSPARLILRSSQEGDCSNELLENLWRVLGILKREQAELVSVEAHQSSLERLFLELTGHSLRD